MFQSAFFLSIFVFQYRKCIIIYLYSKLILVNLAADRKIRMGLEGVKDEERILFSAAVNLDYLFCYVKCKSQHYNRIF